MWSLSILFSFLQTAHAWEAKKNSQGSVLHWLQKDIPFYYHNQSTQLTDSEIEDAMNKAGSAWSFSNINLNNAGKGLASQIDHEDDQFSIVFQESWDEDPEILALTYTWSKSDGEIVHFDIEINADNFTWGTDADSEKHDLQNTLTHELGHAIGLDHSQIEAATMAPSSSAGEINKRELHDDDREGHHHIYGHPLENEEPSNDPVSLGSSNADKPSYSNPGGYRKPLPQSACRTADTPFGFAWIALLGLFRRFR